MNSEARWVRSWDDEVWARVLRRDPCTYCGDASDSVEHVDPRGPRSTVKNGVGACRSCNHERGAVPLLFYLVWRATDRAESFKRWNWRMNSAAIRKMQAHGKLLREGREPSSPGTSGADDARVSVGIFDAAGKYREWNSPNTVKEHQVSPTREGVIRP